MKDTMILTDGTIIDLEASASLSALKVAAADRAAMLETWSKLTPENLSSIQIKNSEGLAVGNYTSLVLDHETSVVSADGSVITDYCLREKTDVEKLADRVTNVEEGQEVQDGAINDIATVAGRLAEQAAQTGGEA